VHRDWSPLGADRFYNLVKNGFYDDIRFFRVLDGFMAQFGMNGTPSIQQVWGKANINDDPVKQSNKRGYVTFAKSGLPNSRSTQVFINFVDNPNLDSQGFAPFGQVVEGMSNVDKLYSGYGRNNVPDQGRITTEGNAYLNKEYPKLDYIKKATIEP
jgi:peptidyl-prolyl cis-trans isomerase A (cyclophilin A)